MSSKKTIAFSISLLASLITPLTNSQPQVLITSIPKCGTNLLRYCVSLITEQKKYDWCEGYTLLNKKQLANSTAFCFVSHAFYSPSNRNQALNQPWQTLFIYRDPRDQIVSMAHWIYKNPKTRPEYAQMDIDTLLLELIERNGPVYSALFDGEEIEDMQGIADLYALYMPWQQQTGVYTTTFERLVGPLGGGDAQAQLTEIMNIAAHIGTPISREQAASVAARLFGNSYTFHEGQIGSWKKYFKQEHIQAFKRVAGQLLIDLGYENDLSW
jgi:hypothetical protein